MNKHDLISQAFLLKYFRYDPETGEFIRLRGCDGKPCKRPCGGTHEIGYRVIGIARKSFYAHRLAWMYVYGRWPEGELDHINGDRADNRIANLREVSRQANMQNMRKANRPKATSQYLGVSYQPRCKTKPWRAVVSKNGKNYCCGHWPTEEEAHAAYVVKKRELHEGCTL